VGRDVVLWRAQLISKHYYRHRYGLIPDHYWENEPTMPLYHVLGEGNGHSAYVVATFDNEEDAKIFAEDSTEVSKTPEDKNWPKVYWVRKNPKYENGCEA